MTYHEFIANKGRFAPPSGFDVDVSTMNRNAFDWQKQIDRWALKKGRCALFADCGLGKGLMALNWAQKVSEHANGPVLILAPLAVSHQFVREGEKFGIPVTLCERQSDVKPGINVTNYEKLHNFDGSKFTGVVLDESSILKGLASATRQELTEIFRNTPYKLCCTATPAPNDHVELGNHSEFLGIMPRSEMLSTYFVHDGGDTAKWRLKGHAEDKFWEWVASWAAVIQSPRDIGYEQDGYDLPPLNIIEHFVKSIDLESPDGQILLIAQTSLTLNERRQARRNSLMDRVSAAAKIANSTDEQYLVWCDLNIEGEELAKAINGAVEVAGRHTDEQKTERLFGFIDGRYRVMVSKPTVAGFGLNLQNCHNLVFVGLSDSFEAYYQAVRRCWRFGQDNPVNVHIITSEAEGAVLDNIKRKQTNAQKMVSGMVEHTKQILIDEIRSTTRISEVYRADTPIIIPNFLRRELA